MRHAARAARVHDTLAALPRGYDTLLSRSIGTGEGTGASDEACDEVGVELSGGQWQRVAPARALLREEPDLPILDEPTSGLDPEAEHEVHKALRRHRRGRTNLLISHRLGTAREGVGRRVGRARRADRGGRAVRGAVPAAGGGVRAVIAVSCALGGLRAAGLWWIRRRTVVITVKGGEHAAHARHG